MKIEKSVHLNNIENTILVHVKEEVDRVLPIKSLPDGYTPMADLQHAYGISKSKLKTCVLKYYQNNGSWARKKRYDASQTIFTSEKKRLLLQKASANEASRDAHR